jgi:UDP-N-acetylglucosamine 1-carboxyvinyltransferase
MSVLLTAADGVSTVTENIFEKRLSHVPELQRMGAKMQVRGNSVIIEGTRGELSGVPVEAHDLRCAAALVIAGLMASGETRIDGVGHITRGYEALPEKMAALGGDVQYIDEPGGAEDAMATA